MIFMRVVVGDLVSRTPSGGYRVVQVHVCIFIVTFGDIENIPFIRVIERIVFGFMMVEGQGGHIQERCESKDGRGNHSREIYQE